MESVKIYWPNWIDTLQHYHLSKFAVWMLESAGPFNVIGAQLLYVAQPFVTPQARKTLFALAQLLEQDDAARAFATLLKG